jgi:hypothetical protein
MALIELSGFESVRDLAEELRSCRTALESIARSLILLTEIPAAPPIEKPIGLENIGSYAQALMETEGETADDLRDRLRKAGLSDTQIESQIIEFLIGNEGGEERTE